MKGRKPSFLNIASYFIFYFSILLIISASLNVYKKNLSCRKVIFFLLHFVELFHSSRISVNNDKTEMKLVK